MFFPEEQTFADVNRLTEGHMCSLQEINAVIDFKYSAKRNEHVEPRQHPPVHKQWIFLFRCGLRKGMYFIEQRKFASGGTAMQNLNISGEKSMKSTNTIDIFVRDLMYMELARYKLPQTKHPKLDEQ